MRALMIVVALVGCWSSSGKSTTDVSNQAANAKVATTVHGVFIGDALELGMVEGPNSAKATLVVVFDFTCPHCSTMDKLVAHVAQSYAGKLRVVYKNYVLHRARSRQLHLAGCAAGLQGKFLAFKKAVFTDQDAILEGMATDPQRMMARLEQGEGFREPARVAGLDVARMETDMKGPRCTEVIQRDHDELEKLGLEFLPVVVVDGKLVGVDGEAGLRAIIDAQLK